MTPCTAVPRGVSGAKNLSIVPSVEGSTSEGTGGNYGRSCRPSNVIDRRGNLVRHGDCSDHCSSLNVGVHRRVSENSDLGGPLGRGVWGEGAWQSPSEEREEVLPTVKKVNIFFMKPKLYVLHTHDQRQRTFTSTCQT